VLIDPTVAAYVVTGQNRRGVSASAPSGAGSLGDVWHAAVPTQTLTGWICTGASTSAATWSPQGRPNVALAAIARHPGFVSGKGYDAFGGPTGNLAIASLNLLMLYAFPLDLDLGINQMIARVTTGVASAQLKIGLWANGAGRPTGLPLVATNAALDCSAAALLSDTISPTKSLSAGWYWWGSVFGGALPSMLATSTTSSTGARQGNAWIGGGTGAAIGSAPITGITTPFTFTNDLSALDLTAATFTEVTSVAVPVLGFRVG
jgi:hypothetical protein